MSLTWHAAVILIKILKRSDHAKKRCLKKVLQAFSAEIFVPKMLWNVEQFSFQGHLRWRIAGISGRHRKYQSARALFVFLETCACMDKRHSEESSIYCPACSNIYFIWFIQNFMSFLIYPFNLAYFMHTLLYLFASFIYDSFIYSFMLGMSTAP